MSASSHDQMHHIHIFGIHCPHSPVCIMYPQFASALLIMVKSSISAKKIYINVVNIKSFLDVWSRFQFLLSILVLTPFIFAVMSSLIPEKMTREWKELLLCGLPLYEPIKGHQPEFDLSTPLDPVELKKQEILNTQDYDEYTVSLKHERSVLSNHGIHLPLLACRLSLLTELRFILQRATMLDFVTLKKLVLSLNRNSKWPECWSSCLSRRTLFLSDYSRWVGMARGSRGDKTTPNQQQHTGTCCPKIKEYCSPTHHGTVLTFTSSLCHQGLCPGQFLLWQDHLLGQDCWRHANITLRNYVLIKMIN